MAAPNPETKEEKQMDLQQDKIVIPKPDKSVIDKLPKNIQEIFNYKPKYEINDNGSLTFYPTPNCEPCNKQLQSNKISMDGHLKKQNCKSAACYSNPDTQIIQETWGIPEHSFITSSVQAWNNHYPFRFRVEHIWLLILQSVAIHVDRYAEKLRNKYVKHESKMKLEIDVSANPSYEEYISIIKAFTEQIDKNTVKDTCKLFECDFSSSTLTEIIATKITIMDICKNYFQYAMGTRCGFPQITLDGTKQDWIKLKTKTIQLLNNKVDKRFGTKWSKALLPLLDRFIVAFDGQIDCLFWNSMIKRGSQHQSGGRQWYSGWFNILFPLINGNNNKFCVPYCMDLDYVLSGDNTDKGDGNDEGIYPSGINAAPVVWNRLGTKINMKFLSGFVGYKQNPKSLEICPNIGWCIAYSMSEKEIQQEKNKGYYW